MMKVLVVNCGSSSVKYSLFDMDGEKKLAWGLVECIGLEESFYNRQTYKTEKIKDTLKIADHTQAVELIIKDLLDKKTGSISNISEIAAVGHRVVHGRDKFSASVLLDEKVKATLRDCFDIAPLHNPANYEGILAVEKMFPKTPSVLVFDTAFHQTMPDYAYMYALPYEYYEKHHIRRYGFHGTSHKYVAQRAAEFLGKPAEELKIITCHLGNGSSLSAVNKGKVIDTSLGFTPLPGIVMGSRSGDIDAAIIPFLMEKYSELKSPQNINSMLNKKSGLIGISGMSDMRMIEDEMSKGNKKAKLAVEMLCYSVKKYIGSYLAALNGADGIVFTAGIGENSSLVRQEVCCGLENLGIKINEEENKIRSDKERFISTADSKIKVMVIPTNEELMIARETLQVLEKE
ncbi:MAG: acetate kinase [Elusimicrobiota bacterium]|nr:acetate kinase [Elusimicrobiota bacterium]